MPELPDVEGFRRVLAKAGGHRVDRVDVLDAGAIRGTSADTLRDAVHGHAFGTARRHGKWLICPIHVPGRKHRKADPSVIFHFGMTGELTWSQHDDGERHQHDRVAFVTGSGELRYRDMRKLHGIRLASDDHEVEVLLAGLGPDAADASRDQLRERAGSGQRRIKSALMDQATIAGLGNLLVDEILWRVHLHPSTLTRDLSDRDWRTLHRTMHATLRKAMSAGRVPDHSSWLTGHRDDRDGACPRCGNVLRHTRVGGRNTAWCPSCQPPGDHD
ncbi:Fpg/Nei family DNA glycosylase [Actinobacteria bacterium YIM 96077]|uniref:Fpg/Nei family DNA glycosylase n=1 Tax=Phytoactinopolyspora halophila TaxID=1981511 RepID=A0A329QG64_9ACTN|nr:DNA-formamidopyrimidine glycosylase family protein [Phytoactinopolyspora halophila]AYY14044.1 Fpg/Nei family DNA glycosylase [Actinobacteria bacterium YIM 96077]RAW10951.1 Fpg/Nei family DNA glycosylase [Phytoactinopolyspora halophila]